MLCLLCISESNEMLEIFDQAGIDLNISTIITKYFWLQPNSEDINAKSICSSCWNTLESFHIFYKSIEEAHNRLTNLKTDNDESSNYETISDLFTTVVKQENSDETTLNLLEIKSNQSIESGDESYDEEKQGLNSAESDSEADVPLTALNARKSSIKLNKNEETSVKESDTDNVSIAQGSDSDYIAAKTKAKVKVKNSFCVDVPCKEFDSFIKKNIKLACNICAKPAETFFSLKEHCQKVHKTKAFATCCERQWTSRFSLVHHLILHQNPDLFKCKKCGRVLANKKSFIRHEKSHRSQESIHECVKCKKSFPSIPKLRRHLKTHSRTDTDQVCEQCGKVYQTKQAMRAHQKREHLGFVKQRVQCPKCGVYLADMSTLKFHTFHLHPKIKVVHSCHICGKVSATAYGLKRHIQYMHTMERIHKCTICEDKAFKTAQILRLSQFTHPTRSIRYLKVHLFRIPYPTRTQPIISVGI